MEIPQQDAEHQTPPQKLHTPHDQETAVSRTLDQTVLDFDFRIGVCCVS